MVLFLEPVQVFPLTAHPPKEGTQTEGEASPPDSPSTWVNAAFKKGDTAPTTWSTPPDVTGTP